MRYLIGIGWLVVLFNISVAVTPAFAATCSERQQVCFAYCEKTYNNAPKCKATCEDLLSICKTTGCWESKVAAKRCDFDRR
jgi:hypothetical protein